MSHEEITDDWAGQCFICFGLATVCLSVISVVLCSMVLYNVGKFDSDRFQTRSHLTSFRSMLASVQAVAMPSFQFSVYFFLVSLAFLQKIKLPYGPGGLAPSSLVVISFGLIASVQRSFQHRALRLKALTYKGDIIPLIQSPLKIKNGTIQFQWARSFYHPNYSCHDLPRHN